MLQIENIDVAYGDVQVLKGDVVDDLIERPLEKCRIDRNNRLETRPCEPGCKGCCVLLGNAHIEEALGILVTEPRQTRSLPHGRRYHDQVSALFTHLNDDLSKHIGERGKPGMLVKDPRLLVE